MAVPLALPPRQTPAVEPVAFPTQPNAAGSLVLRRMDRRGRAKKHGTKSGTGAPLRRGLLLLLVGAANV